MHLLFNCQILTARIAPDFQERKEALVKVAKCTCSLAARYPDDNYATGTAFFVGPTTLLTARHVAPDHTTDVVAQLPGVRTAIIDSEKLFDENPVVETFVCRVVLDGPAWLVDVTILDCSNSHFRAVEWLELDRTSLKKGVKVDLVGYPGAYSSQYVAKTQELPLLGKSEYRDIEELLPSHELTITHGAVILGGKTCTYRVSTIGGMSGSPVVVSGKAVGMPCCE